MISFDEAVIAAVKRVAPSVVALTMLNGLGTAFGTGLIFDKKGYILTNAHVVNGTSKLLATQSDGKKYRGKIQGMDIWTDLAVIKISGQNFPVPELGDSDKLQVGQMTIAIGNALGLPGSPTVTTGVISALNRYEEEGIVGYIQTDAHINPGNSGGPLINSSGEVIGINSLGMDEAEGVGYAIPINTAKKIAGDLKVYGAVIRPYLGIYGLDLGYFKSYGLREARGIHVQNVESKSPAAKVGIKRGDAILKMEGRCINSVNDLMLALTEVKAGEEVKLKLERKGKPKEINVKLGESPLTGATPGAVMF